MSVHGSRPLHILSMRQLLGLVVALGITSGSALAQYTDIRRLGTSNAVSRPGPQTGEDLQRVFRENRAVLRDPERLGAALRGELDFELPECPVRVFGEVIYRRGEGRSLGELCQGVGIHFSDLDKESEEAIQQLVETIAARYAP